MKMNFEFTFSKNIIFILNICITISLNIELSGIAIVSTYLVLLIIVPEILYLRVFPIILIFKCLLKVNLEKMHKKLFARFSGNKINFKSNLKSSFYFQYLFIMLPLFYAFYFVSYFILIYISFITIWVIWLTQTEYKM